MSDRRIDIVVEHLRADGWEPSDDGSDEGSLEKMAAELLEALDKELPETKPTAWQRLGEWLTDVDEGPSRTWERSLATMTEPARVELWDGGHVEVGEGPTLDDALMAAMEKLK